MAEKASTYGQIDLGEESHELTDGDLEALGGGAQAHKRERCPYCGSKSVVCLIDNVRKTITWKCKLCKKTW